jgi:hypothetical protein
LLSNFDQGNDFIIFPTFLRRSWWKPVDRQRGQKFVVKNQDMVGIFLSKRLRINLAQEGENYLICVYHNSTEETMKTALPRKVGKIYGNNRKNTSKGKGKIEFVIIIIQEGCVT